MKNPDTIILGIGINPLWGMEKNTDFDKQRVLREIEQRLNLDDDAITIKDSIHTDWKEASNYVVSSLILAYGIMDALNIPRVHYVGTEGANAVGTLLTPKYWVSCKIQRASVSCFFLNRNNGFYE